ncbi:zinc finger protein 723-like isoform X7 [Diabrotica virgifera virgifera]|uniref:C2H2-type domain-containing protein n=1 Tax=Diabrotica virgifera virgifera TaxID=50390 RepID=A0ABM5KBV0_DIAVI|nr:zinc finger protein 723-like isoform X7 [Diabrotica virgifera virgifera]
MTYSIFTTVMYVIYSMFIINITIMKSHNLMFSQFSYVKNFDLGKFNNMEVKQEASEMISCKVETDNETFDGPLDAFKVEIKEEPKTEPAYDTFGYLDCNEFPLKTEVEQEQDECKFTPSETKQTANESCSQEQNKMKSMETVTAHSSHTHTGSYTGRHAEGKPLNKNMKAVSARRPGKCEICFKKFTHASYLKIHLRVHTGIKPYKCEVCFKQFSEAGSLKKHLRMHTGETPYKCEICLKKFTTSSRLKSHWRIHTGEQPYKCEVCFKQFADSSSSKKHLRVHTGEKLTKCEICFKQFRDIGHLKTHLRVHTGEQPYKCEICFKQFSQTCHLKRHLRVHTGEKPYKCEICFKQFSDARTLKRHLRVHTRETPL